MNEAMAAEFNPATPDEMIDEAVETLEGDLRIELLETLSGINPYRFERAVLDLLFAVAPRQPYVKTYALKPGEHWISPIADLTP